MTAVYITLLFRYVCVPDSFFSPVINGRVKAVGLYFITFIYLHDLIHQMIDSNVKDLWPTIFIPVLCRLVFLIINIQ